jgi:alanine transaminase
MSITNLKIIDFCSKNGLVLMADEVYQENVYYKQDRPWSSFKKVLKSMGEAYENVELFSFHSVSKGFVGECGHRSGYLEAVGIDPAVKAQLYKLASILLCPNTVGQLMVFILCV